MNYRGTDLYKHKSHVVVIDDNGEVEHEVRVANANLDDLAQSVRRERRAIEDTGNDVNSHKLNNILYFIYL